MQLMPCPVCGKDKHVAENPSQTDPVGIGCTRCGVYIECQGESARETARTLWNAIAPQKERATMTTLANRVSHLYQNAKVKHSRGGHGFRLSYDLVDGDKLIEYCDTLQELMRKIAELAAIRESMVAGMEVQNQPTKGK